MPILQQTVIYYNWFKSTWENTFFKQMVKTYLQRSYKACLLDFEACFIDYLHVYCEFFMFVIDNVSFALFILKLVCIYIICILKIEFASYGFFQLSPSSVAFACELF